MITGGSSGIGRATALAFRKEGAKVAIADIQTEGGKKKIQMTMEEEDDVIFVKTDVSKAADVKALINRIIKTYGRLDCAYNNAGIEGTLAPTADYTEEEWDRIIATNLKGTWLCMKYEILQMLKQGGGVIVNASSVNGLIGGPAMPAYSASKGGIIQLTRTAALEYAKANIRVNAICPGPIHTPMLERIFAGMPGAEEQIPAAIPMGRAGNAEEIAKAVVWLCSDAASFVTGHALVIDGGMVIQ